MEAAEIKRKPVKFTKEQTDEIVRLMRAGERLEAQRLILRLFEEGQPQGEGAA
jgi:hypothetical protein